MTDVKTAEASSSSLSRDLLYAARYYLGYRWVLLALGGLAVVLGLVFGGWSWLVAAGLAPLVLSTLPCLVMCAFGVCMMCRSGERQSTVSRDATVPIASSAALGATKTDNSPAGAATCCHGQVSEMNQIDEVESSVADLQPVEERKDSHA